MSAATRRARACMAPLFSAAACGTLAMTIARAAGAQSLLPSMGWGVSPSISVWHFATPIPQPSGAVADVAETVLPFRVRASRGAWHVDLSGAGVFGAVHVSGKDDDRLITVGGPTDVKVRVAGPIFTDATQLTIGLNVPTGKVGLNVDQTATVQALAAPALQLPVGTFGNGAGATIGLLHAFQGDGWALALGASGEKRAEYSPIALALTSGTSNTHLAPGLAAHVTAGLDRTVGEGRFSALAVADFYTRDQVRIDGATVDTSNNYTLGPQLSATGQFDFGGGAWRERSVALGARMRSAYKNAAGETVRGSNGTYFEGSLGGVLGGAEGAGLVLGTDARWQSGLSFTDVLVGAAASAVGVTLGVERAGSSTATRFTLHGAYGTFDTGAAKSTGVSLTIGFSIGARREVP